jgi:hypothetical protein
MPRTSRFLIAAVLGFAAALMLPVYPLRSEVRSLVGGGGGDLISHHWSLHTLFGLLGALQYESSQALPLTLGVGLFVLLAASLTFGASKLLQRIF